MVLARRSYQTECAQIGCTSGGGWFCGALVIGPESWLRYGCFGRPGQAGPPGQPHGGAGGLILSLASGSSKEFLQVKEDSQQQETC